jgi:hypothetical protein
VQACVADPGAVRTNIYNNSPKLSKGLINVMINKFYAPPEVGGMAGGGGGGWGWGVGGGVGASQPQAVINVMINKS